MKKNIKIILHLLLVIFLYSGCTLFKSGDVRVMLAGYPLLDEFTINTDKDKVCLDGEDIQCSTLLFKQGNEGFFLDGLTSISVKKLVIEANPEVEFKTPKMTQIFTGIIEIFFSGKSPVIHNILPRELYMASVLGAEMGDSFHDEALKAQAIAIRSYLRAREEMTSGMNDSGGIKNSPGTDMSFRGISFATQRMQAAVQATRGERLFLKDGKPALPLFHSTSGGVILRDEVFSSTIEKPVCDAVLKKDYDAQGSILSSESPNFRFSFFLSDKELCLIAERDGFEISSVKQLYFPETECVDYLYLQAADGEKIWLKGFDFLSRGQRLGFFREGSIQFRVEKEYGGFQIVGNGFGHLCGMSQYSAQALAQKGWTYMEILDFYYPEYTLRKTGDL
ncbi:MAG: hypothetical protein EHM28_05925 [Spirochaetaceae bacterium]|nr:MAG: hypothetical protein EHM28_05925 [Spirochaetaceae bacterium]